MVSNFLTSEKQETDPNNQYFRDAKQIEQFLDPRLLLLGMVLETGIGYLIITIIITIIINSLITIFLCQ